MSAINQKNKYYEIVLKNGQIIGQIPAEKIARIKELIGKKDVRFVEVGDSVVNIDHIASIQQDRMNWQYGR